MVSTLFSFLHLMHSVIISNVFSKLNFLALRNRRRVASKSPANLMCLGISMPSRCNNSLKFCRISSSSACAWIGIQFGRPVSFSASILGRNVCHSGIVLLSQSKTLPFVAWTLLAMGGVRFCSFVPLTCSAVILLLLTGESFEFLRKVA